MGRYAASVVRARPRGREHGAFRYRDRGNLATIGRAAAVADIKGVRLSGFPAWATWLVVHLWSLIGFQNRLLVLIRRSFSFATHGRGARLVTGASTAGHERDGRGANNRVAQPAAGPGGGRGRPGTTRCVDCRRRKRLMSVHLGEGKEQSMIVRHAFIGLIGVGAVLCASTAMGQTARDIRGPAPVVPLASEPAPRIVIDPPLAEWLAQGRVVIQYRAENLRIVPVFGPNALDVSPRIGHIHVTVDDSPWRWADASGEPLIINCLLPGPHKVLIELVNANHQTLERGVVTFVVPVRWSGC